MSIVYRSGGALGKAFGPCNKELWTLPEKYIRACEGIVRKYEAKTGEKFKLSYGGRRNNPTVKSRASARHVSDANGELQQALASYQRRAQTVLGKHRNKIKSSLKLSGANIRFGLRWGYNGSGKPLKPVCSKL